MKNNKQVNCNKDLDSDFLRGLIENMEQQLEKLLLKTDTKSTLDSVRIKELKDNIKYRKEQLEKIEKNSINSKKWKVIRHKLKGTKVELPNNNPKNSGYYLCTCVYVMEKKIVERYLQVMYYDETKNCWRDRKNSSGISHTILAWRDDIKPCKVTNVEYIGGGYFI